MKNILGTYLEKDGFYILAKRNPMDFIIGECEYVISVQGGASLYIYLDRPDEVDKFMECLAIEIDRVDKLTLTVLIDCLSICTNAMEDCVKKERILSALARSM